MRCDRSAVGPWEKWRIQQHPGYPAGVAYTLDTGARRTLWYCSDTPTHNVTCASTTRGPSEAFTFARLETGVVAIRAFGTGKYCNYLGVGKSPTVACTSDTVGTAERFMWGPIPTR